MNFFDQEIDSLKYFFSVVACLYFLCFTCVVFTCCESGFLHFIILD